MSPLRRTPRHCHGRSRARGRRLSGRDRCVHECGLGDISARHTGLPAPSLGTPETPPAHIATVSDARAYVSFSGSPSGVVWLFDFTTGGIVTETAVPRPLNIALDASRARLIVAASVGFDQVALEAIDSTAAGYTTVATGLWSNLVLTPAGVSCLFEIAPRSTFVAASGGAGQWTIPAPAGCPWSVTPEQPGITVEPLAGTGPGTVTYTVSAATDPRRTLYSGRVGSGSPSTRRSR